MASILRKVFLLNEFDDNLAQYTKFFKFKTRPNAGSGCWLFYLVPLAVIVSTLKLEHVTKQYRSISLFSVELIIVGQALMVAKPNRSTYLNIKNFILTAGTVLVVTLNNEGIIFNIISAILSASFFIVLPTVLYCFPYCFTIGEAAILSQSILTLILSTGLSILNAVINKIPTTDMEISTVVLQIGLLGILFLSITLKTFENLRNPKSFYTIVIATIGLLMLLPMHLVLQQDAVIWILIFLFYSKRKIIMFGYWLFCTILGIKAVSYQINSKQKANASRRKVFHLLSILVYIPALIYECTLIYLASGVVLAIFILLEIIRILNIPPLGSILHDGFLIFVDEKDSTGGVAMSPIYLLAGISIPIWLHPYCCDLTDSVGFQLLPVISGLLTIGIGDTMASVIGTRFGKHHWPNSKKTYEGTLGSIVTQMLFIGGLYFTGYVGNTDLPKIAITILITSIIEAKTDQIDNLVLPILAYILLV